MALDTVDKRGSAMLLGAPWRGWVGVPSGTVDQPTRQGLAWLGASILAAAPEQVRTYLVAILGGPPFGARVDGGPPYRVAIDGAAPYGVRHE